MEFIREKIKEKPIRKRKIFLKIATAVVCGVVFSIVVLAMMFLFMPKLQTPMDTEDMQTESQSETEETQSTENAIAFPTDLSLSISDYQTLQDELYKIGNEVNTSIVTVAALSTEDADWSVNPFEVEGQSSGIIVSEDDNYLYILTEKKVISDAGHIRVSFIDNTGAVATMLKYDGNTGLAVVTVEKSQLGVETKRNISVAQIGSSYEMANGSIVIALGSPLGTNYSILTGNITSIQNEIATQDKNYSVFTTDIVAGENASGVLVNTKGEVVGIVMQSFSGSQEVSTLTAVEVDELKEMIEILCDGKDVPYVGVYLSTVTEEISKDYDIPVGVYIKDVVTDSPAMYAGLQSGDVIVKINGKRVAADAVFSERINKLIPGTTCELTVKRQNGDAYYDVSCTVEIGVLK